MSFFLTTEQMRNRTKDVTRRMGWKFLKPGDVVMACVKAIGLRKGEKIERIHPIKILSNEPEPLIDIHYRPCRNRSKKTEVEREGFPDMSPAQFVKMLCDHYGCKRDVIVNRIEFLHLEDKACRK
jgi:hypothetical protein